jgi:hypothetical protein
MSLRSGKKTTALAFLFDASCWCLFFLAGGEGGDGEGSWLWQMDIPLSYTGECID